MPARVAGLDRKGVIEPGYDADLVIFDPDAEFTVDAAILHDSHTRTPYVGRRLRGVIERMYLRGHRIYERGKEPKNRTVACSHVNISDGRHVWRTRCPTALNGSPALSGLRRPAARSVSTAEADPVRWQGGYEQQICCARHAREHPTRTSRERSPLRCTPVVDG
jgi:hypothetical protein